MFFTRFMMTSTWVIQALAAMCKWFFSALATSYGHRGQQPAADDEG